MVKKVTKKRMRIITTSYIIFGVMAIIGILVIRYFWPVVTPISNILIFLLLLTFFIVNLFIQKYKIGRINRFVGYAILIANGYILFIGGSHFYEDFVQFHSLEKKLSVNNIYFYGDVDKEVVLFLNNINPNYTKGIHDIIFLPFSPFSYTIEINGELIGGGIIKGEYKSDTKDIFVVLDDNYQFSFYHEVGHYIFNRSLTSEDRSQWKEALNFSGQIEDAAKEANISKEEFSARYINNIQRETIEKFADGFALIITNESLIPEHPGKEYLKHIIKRFE